MAFGNTNGLVRSIALEHRPVEDRLHQRGGPLPRDAGADVASKDLIVVLLDSWGKNSRVGDANTASRSGWKRTQLGRPALEFHDR